MKSREIRLLRRPPGRQGGRKIPLLGAILMLWVGMACAQTPQILEINGLYGESDGSEPADFCTIGSVSYFSADDGSFAGHGRELWVTDGTAAGTALVGDINNGPDSSDPQNLTAINGMLYFSADDGVNGRELWVYDGTSLTLVDVSTSGDSSPAHFCAFNSAIYFAAEGDSGDGRELWKYDGTTASLAGDIHSTAGSDPTELVVMGASLYFAADNGVDGRQVMRHETDGTTILIKNVSYMVGSSTDPAELSAYPEELTVCGSVLYYSAEWLNREFVATGMFGEVELKRRELFVTDGTETGTVRISDIGVWESDLPAGGMLFDQSDANVRELTLMNGTLHFIAHEPSYLVNFMDMYGGWTEVWKTDGTLAGTQRITQVAWSDGLSPAAANSADVQYLTAMGSHLYFSATDGNLEAEGEHNQELWRTDGAALGNEELVKDINQYLTGDGSTGSPYKNQASDPQHLCAVNTAAGERLFFQANDGPEGDGRAGAELWISDGTEAGTVRVKNLLNGGNGEPEGLVPLGSKVVFSAETPNLQYGRELYISDGTEAGTFIVADVAPGPTHSEPEYLTAMGDTLFFSATDAIHGYELWATQGTPGTTSLVKDIESTQTSDETPYGLTILDQELYFFRLDDGERRPNLYKTDGTEAGTVLVHDFFPAGSPEDPQTPSEIGDPSELTAMGSAVFFSAYDLELRGLELWTSDGTDIGTFMLKDIEPTPWNPVYGDHASKPSNFTVVDDTLFLVATASSGRDLWKSDGTEPGTVLVADIDIDPSTLGGATPVGECVAVGSRLFWVPNTYTHGKELWVSDGTEAGTVITKDIRAGTADSSPQNLEALGGRVFFAANDGTNGNELWVSDGTEAGTLMVADINTAGSSGPEELAAIGSTLYFSADDGSAGAELWAYDTIADSLSMVADLNAGDSSSPADITPIGGAIFMFTADDGVNGREMWISDGTSAGTRLLFDLAAGADSSDPEQLTLFGDYLGFVADDNTIAGREPWVVKIRTVAPDTTALAFDAQLEGRTQMLSVDICNEGETAIQFTDALIADAAGPDLGAFTVISAPASGATMDPGACITIDVAFLPTAPGDMTAVLQVHTSDPFNPVIQISLEGTGLEDGTLPAFSNVEATPAEALRGDEVTITFDVSEELQYEPQVDVNGLAATIENTTGTTYTFTITIPEDASYGPALVEIRGLDLANNIGSYSSSSELEIVPPVPAANSHLLLLLSAVLPGFGAYTLRRRRR